MTKARDIADGAAGTVNLSGYATTNDLYNYALTTDLAGYATTSALATKLDVNSTLNPANLDSNGTIPSALLAGVGGGVTPSFSAHAGNTGQTVNNNTNTKVTFDTELFDSDGKFNNSRFTPTVAGKYLIAAAVSFSNHAANAYTQLRVKKNGADVFQEATQNVASIADTKTQSVFVLDLDEDDYVEIFARQNSGTTQTLRTGMEVRFSGFKIA